MYRVYPSLVLGFHLCEREVGEKALANDKNTLRPSQNEYDWLGHGVYFWENSPDRANQFAADVKGTKWERKNPFVLGAVIYLGRCFNLLDMNCLNLLKESYRDFADISAKVGIDMPQNRPGVSGRDLLYRSLDCAIIQFMHSQVKHKGHLSYDTIRGAFWEGGELYPNAGLEKKNHVQICVRNPNSIKGFTVIP